MVPFTLAHVAVAPPLWRLTRRRLVLSALVVGAMAPDFEYLVWLSPHRGIGHTPTGVAVLCLPASLAVLAVWHRFVGPAFAPLLPGHLGDAARREFRFGPAPRFLQICASAAVGAFSHLAWDSFTHNPSAMVTRLGILSNAAWAGGPPGYVVAWWASSIGGTLVVAWSLLRSGMARRHPIATAPTALPRIRRQTWAALAAGAAALATANALRLVGAGGGPHQVLIGGVLGAMSGTALAAVAAGAALRARIGSVD